jgi:hypothetical protein
MSAPERIWVCPDDETWQAGNWDLASDGMENEAEYIRAAVAKAQREEAVKRALLVAASFVGSFFPKSDDANDWADDLLWNVAQGLVDVASDHASIADIIKKAEGGE